MTPELFKAVIDEIRSILDRQYKGNADNLQTFIRRLQDEKEELQSMLKYSESRMKTLTEELEESTDQRETLEDRVNELKDELLRKTTILKNHS